MADRAPLEWGEATAPPDHTKHAHAAGGTRIGPQRRTLRRKQSVELFRTVVEISAKYPNAVAADHEAHLFGNYRNNLRSENGVAIVGESTAAWGDEASSNW